MNLRRILLVAVLAVTAALAFAYLLRTPRLLSTSPVDGAANIAAGAPLRLVFSQTMRPDDITSRLSFQPPVRGAFSWEGSTLVFNPSQPWPGGALVKVRLDSGARAAGLLPFAMNRAYSWSFRIGAPRLAYLYPANAAADLYLMNPITAETRRLTNFPNGVLDFDVSASGSAIFFSAANDQTGSDLYRLDLAVPESGAPAASPPAASATPLAASQPQLLLSCGADLCRYPRLSPLGNFMAYERKAAPGGISTGYPQVWLQEMDLQGHPANTGPVPAGEVQHQTLQPQWSPSNLLTFYDSTQQEFVILEPVHGGTTRFPNQTGQAGSWDPTGEEFVAQEISFPETAVPTTTTGMESFASSHLMRFNRLDGSVLDLTQDDRIEDASPAYSPDGVFIALGRKYLDTVHWSPGRQIWLMLANGKDAHPLTDDPDFNYFDFAWHPDNDQIAAVRFNQTSPTDLPEIWLVNPINTQAVQLIIGGYSPRWIP